MLYIITHEAEMFIISYKYMYIKFGIITWFNNDKEDNKVKILLRDTIIISYFSVDY